jgi:hypothetical protein
MRNLPETYYAESRSEWRNWDCSKGVLTLIHRLNIGIWLLVRFDLVGDKEWHSECRFH